MSSDFTNYCHVRVYLDFCQYVVSFPKLLQDVEVLSNRILGTCKTKIPERTELFSTL